MGENTENSAGFRSRFHSIAEFRPARLQFQNRSISAFAELFCEDALSRQELEELVDAKKKEPTKVTKEQIKEYGNKYRDYQHEDKKEGAGSTYRWGWERVFWGATTWEVIRCNETADRQIYVAKLYVTDNWYIPTCTLPWTGGKYF